MNWQEVLSNVVYPAMAGLLATVIGLLVSSLIDFVKRKSSTLKYGAAVGVVADAVQAAWTRKIKPSVFAKLSDGRLTPEEWETLRIEVTTEARRIAEEHLLELRGFAPGNIGKWVEVQADKLLGELIGSIVAGSGEAETDPLANAPASDQ
jgi:hypothetical protein